MTAVHLATYGFVAYFVRNKHHVKDKAASSGLRRSIPMIFAKILTFRNKLFRPFR